MKLRLRTLICCLLIFTLIPINYTFATVIVDRDEDGINIDDIVYYLSQTDPLSSVEVISLLEQIAPVSPMPTAEEVAISIQSITPPEVDATSLILPSVPEGYSISIFSSSDPGVIGTDGVIIPPAIATNINLVFTVTRTEQVQVHQLLLVPDSRFQV